MNTRIQFKHDTETNWNQTPNFVPLSGEKIIYDSSSDSEPKVKIGDGTTTLSSLPFSQTENNYTTTEKTKLAGIETNANNYTLPPAGNSLGGVISEEKEDSYTKEIKIDSSTNKLYVSNTGIFENNNYLDINSVLNPDISYIAPSYNSLTFPIKIGTYCFYNYLLYRCISTIQTQEDFTSSHWEEVNVMGQLITAPLLTIDVTVNGSASAIGQTISLYKGTKNSHTDLINTYTYSGAAIGVRLLVDTNYYITITNEVNNYYVNDIEGTMAEDGNFETFIYNNVNTITSFSQLAQVVGSLSEDSSENLIGLEIDDTWTNITTNAVYSSPMICVSIENVIGTDNQTHRAAICQRKYATIKSLPFDPPEQVIATESTALSDVYYWGLPSDSSLTAANLVALNLTTGATIPYDSYGTIYKNSINDKNIIIYGYNRYRDSFIRQWLTNTSTSQVLTEWWSSTHTGDTAPSTSTLPPYQTGCSSELLAAAKPIKISCSTNNITDSTITDEMYDLFWLPSGAQMYGSVNTEEGTYWKYWGQATSLSTPSNSANDGRKIYLEALVGSTPSTFQYCRLRSANSDFSYYAWYLMSTGQIYGYGAASRSYCATPACAIY